jgi:hypothetical protein
MTTTALALKESLVSTLRSSKLTDNGCFTFDNTNFVNPSKGKDKLEWRTLVAMEDKLKTIFADPKQVKSLCTSFRGGDYEHNTIDRLFSLSGLGLDRFTISTGNLIGQMRLDNVTLKVSSRFGDDFLKYLIADADGFLEVKNLGSHNKGNDLKWLLVYLWKTKLKQAFRLGVPKAYVNQRERLNTLRGRLDLIDYEIRGQHEGRLLCDYREHSYDTPTGRLIASAFKAVERMKLTSLISDCHRIKDAFLTASQGQRSPIDTLLNTAPFSNPFYHEYNEVIHLSKMLLRQDYSDFGGTSQDSAFFFDVSMLFEHFIRKVLMRSGIPLQPKGQSLGSIPSGNDTYSRKLIPDILYQDELGQHLFDVKYKHFDTRYGVSREDIFQIHTYAGQVLNSGGSLKRIGFIYPVKASTESRLPIRQALDIGGHRLNFEVHFLVIPRLEAACGGDLPTPKETTIFYEEFAANCCQFRDQFIEHLR